MDFRIAEEDRLLQDSVRSFVEEKANAVWKQIEHSGELPQSLIDGMRELGLFGLSIPPVCKQKIGVSAGTFALSCSNATGVS